MLYSSESSNCLSNNPTRGNSGIRLSEHINVLSLVEQNYANGRAIVLFSMIISCIASMTVLDDRRCYI